ANAILELPRDWFNTETQSFGNGYTVAEDPAKPQVYENLSAEFNQPEFGTVVTLKNRTAMETQDEMFQVPVAKSAISTNRGGTLTITSDQVRGKKLHAKLETRDGRTFIVPT